MEEPAGLWFESCGGWDRHQPAAAALRRVQRSETLEERQLSRAPTLPSSSKGWEERDGMLYILDRSSEDEEVGDAAATCPAVAEQQLEALQVAADPPPIPMRVSSSWRLPGHTWTARGDINGPPPRGPADLLVGCSCAKWLSGLVLGV